MTHIRSRGLIVLNLTLSLILVLLLIGATPLSAHFLSYDAVDESPTPPEIQYSRSTDYVAANDWAIARWEALAGGVDIRPYSSGNNDLTVYDTYSTSSWAGKYTWITLVADRIQYNERLMDTYSTAKQRNVATHEWGHAHGLAHSYSGQIMYAYVSTIEYLQSHDITDYNVLWE